MKKLNLNMDNITQATYLSWVEEWHNRVEMVDCVSYHPENIVPDDVRYILWHYLCFEGGMPPDIPLIRYVIRIINERYDEYDIDAESIITSMTI